MAHAPKRTQHPMPMVITHWINLSAMFFLVLSGIYIHYPFVPGLMGLARGTHFFWMFVLIVNLIVRLVFLFTIQDSNLETGEGAKADIYSFLPQKENRHQLWPFIKYYLFMKKEAPIQGKYNPLQKVAYLFVPILIVIAAWSGFSIWGPTMNWPFFFASRAWVANWFNTAGGADPMNMRILHYFTMWAIVLFTLVHAYLANIYNFNPSKLMFKWEEVPEEH